MAKVRLAADEPRIVPWLDHRTVQPDEVVIIPDDQFDSYVCQDIWQAVEPPKPKPAVKRAAKEGE
jgi:hypothetical protein